MTHATKRAPRLAALPAALIGALALAGCSTGHIGDSWQCPLAEGGLCDSVAAADPAVPDPGAAGTTVLAEPLWRMRGAPGPAVTAERPCAAECDGGFDPFAWLSRLFDDDIDVPGSLAETGGPASGEIGPASADAEPDTARTPAATEPAPAKTASRPAEPAAPLPAPGSGPGQAPGPSRDGTAPEDPPADDLRTGEVVARIWIAPFVDADGVYREASHVRVVLEPAGWRLK